jgi:hypothetical protein
MRRSPLSSRRSLATPLNSASRSTTTKRPSSIAHPAIAAISVLFAGSLLKPWRLSRQTRRRCPVGSKAKRMRSAPRLRATSFPHIPSSQIRLGRRPSQSNGHSPTRAFWRAFDSFRLGDLLPCLFSISALRRARLPARSSLGEPPPPMLTPSAATASSPPRWRPTIPESPTNSPCRQFSGCRRTPTASGNSTRAAAGQRRFFPISPFQSAPARPGCTLLEASAGTRSTLKRNINSCASLNSSSWPRWASMWAGAGRRPARRQVRQICIRQCLMSASASALCPQA